MKCQDSAAGVFVRAAGVRRIGCVCFVHDTTHVGETYALAYVFFIFFPLFKFPSSSYTCLAVRGLASHRGRSLQAETLLYTEICAAAAAAILCICNPPAELLQHCKSDKEGFRTQQQKSTGSLHIIRRLNTSSRGLWDDRRMEPHAMEREGGG